MVCWGRVWQQPIQSNGSICVKTEVVSLAPIHCFSTDQPPSYRKRSGRFSRLRRKLRRSANVEASPRSPDIESENEVGAEALDATNFNEDNVSNSILVSQNALQITTPSPSISSEELNVREIPLNSVQTEVFQELEFGDGISALLSELASCK